ncbi:MAG TPA: methyltransferase domain-containing protein [Gemmatimonadaceae bacterium]|nr:methyltransferase domain-containing protein [Gemmatimonadaceae bacterium]
MRPAEIDAIEADLSRRFVTARTRLTLTDRVYEFVHPRAAEDLISEEDFARDERLPYWADIWPSGVVLAEGLSGLDGAGLRMLELGCGVGVVAAAAAQSGFEVLATDYYDDALRFTRVNVARNTGTDPETRLVDWRDWPEDLTDFELVAAADVLYEARYATLVPGVLARAMSQEGRALVADPGRVATPRFVAECERIGLAVTSLGKLGYERGEIRQAIEVMEIRRTRTSA